LVQLYAAYEPAKLERAAALGELRIGEAETAGTLLFDLIRT
jgi:hypothetical protein